MLCILPWDYNLAFGTYALGMTNPVQDPNVLINYPDQHPGGGRGHAQPPALPQRDAARRALRPVSSATLTS